MALTTDATPRIHLTPTQVLQDKHRMKRLKAALGNGIFSYADDTAATQIMDEILKICGESVETISEVLQTKFFLDHTPFHWILTNRHSKPGVPPLFARLLSACDELTEHTQEHIMDALYRKYDSEVYAAVKDKLTGVPTHEACNESFFGGREDRLIVTAERDSGWIHDIYKRWNVHFKIPKFLDRLAVDGEVWFEFLAHETLFRLTATLLEPDHQLTYSRWQFKVEEIRSRTSALTMYHGKSHWCVSMNLPFQRRYQGHSQVPVKSTLLRRATKELGIMPVGLIPTPDDPYQQNIDSLIASGRDVSGTLTIYPT